MLYLKIIKWPFSFSQGKTTGFYSYIYTIYEVLRIRDVHLKNLKCPQITHLKEIKWMEILF